MSIQSIICTINQSHPSRAMTSHNIHTIRTSQTRDQYYSKAHPTDQIRQTWEDHRSISLRGQIWRPGMEMCSHHQMRGYGDGKL